MRNLWRFLIVFAGVLQVPVVTHAIDTANIHVDESLRGYNNLAKYIELSKTADGGSMRIMETEKMYHTWPSLAGLVSNLNQKGLYITGVYPNKANPIIKDRIYDSKGHPAKTPVSNTTYYMLAYDPPTDCSDVEHSVVDGGCSHDVATLPGAEPTPTTRGGDCVKAGCRCDSMYMPVGQPRIEDWLPQVACVNKCDGYGENTMPTGYCGDDWNERPDCVAQYCGCKSGYERGTGSNSNTCVAMTNVKIEYECGSDGTGAPPDMQVVEPGTEFTFPENTCNPPDHGIFMGWRFFNTIDSKKYYPGEEYSGFDSPGYYLVLPVYSSYSDPSCTDVTSNDTKGDCVAVGYRCLSPYVYRALNGTCVPVCSGAETNMNVCTELSDISPNGTPGGCATLYCQCPENMKSKDMQKIGVNRWISDLKKEPYTGLCYTE